MKEMVLSSKRKVRVQICLLKTTSPGIPETTCGKPSQYAWQLGDYNSINAVYGWRVSQNNGDIFSLGENISLCLSYFTVYKIKFITFLVLFVFVNVC